MLRRPAAGGAGSADESGARGVGKWEALKEDLLRRKDSIDRSIERFGKEIAELPRGYIRE